MDTVYKSEQISILSDSLNISKTDVKAILDAYISRLTDKLEKGETVKFLNICYLVNVSKGRNGYHETLAYISNEIGTQVKIGKDVVYRVLSDFEDIIAQDVSRFYTYTIRGIIGISRCEYKKGVFKLRVKKSSVYNSVGIRVVTLNSFRRKVEYYDRKDS